MENRTVLITCIQKYMGEAIATKFKAMGFNVLTDDRSLVTQSECEALIESSGTIDVLVVLKLLL